MARWVREYRYSLAVRAWTGSTGALPLCQSADLDPGTATRDSAFDLSGNLAEWTDDCRTILSDGTGRRAYTLRGGSFTHSERALRCDFMSLVVAENFAFSDTGFRCCSSCPPGQADCNGTCADLGTSTAHSRSVSAEFLIRLARCAANEVMRSGCQHHKRVTLAT